MVGTVRVRRGVLERMIAEAERTPGQECCGLLAGRAGVITTVFPARNAAASATQYEIAPEELFSLFRRMRAEGMELMGIYHSHPTGDTLPSRRDLERAYYPDTGYFILSLDPGVAERIRAFSIRNAKAHPLAIEVV